jgi:hypothetical protein
MTLDSFPRYSASSLRLELDDERTTGTTSDLAGFYHEVVVVLQERPHLIPFARKVQRILERFVSCYDIKSRWSLEDMLDQDEAWCDLIESVVKEPLKHKLALDICDAELDCARDKISWMLNGDTASENDFYW